MLASNVLKLRLDRIEQQGHHLSVKDQLRLVTLAQPELTADFYTQLFQPTLPKTWHFQHNTAEEMSCSLRLIDLINQVFIPEYRQHAQRYAWFEQGLAFRLQYTNQYDQSQDIQEILNHLVQCKDSSIKLSVLRQLQAQYADVEIKLVLAEVYKRSQDWSLAIEYYQAVFEQQSTQPERIHYDFIHCLLSRNDHLKGQGNADVVEALQHLANLAHIQQTKKYAQLTAWAVSLLLPETLQSNSMHSSKLLMDLQHKLQSIGYTLNQWLSASELLLPYYKHVVEIAPQLLNQHEIVSSLDRHKAANEALQKILTGRDLKLVSGVNTSNYSLGFIWNYLQINPLVLDALVAASKGNPEVFYNLKQIPAADYDHNAAVARLSCYLAKQQVAYNLSQQGHTIEFAEHSNLSSFDLIVDGTPMQVKCSLDIEGVEQFAQRYPHIAIIVNIELAHLQEKYPSVFTDLALSYETVQRTAEASLQHLAVMDDFLPIPLMNTGFAVYRNFSTSHSKQPTRPYLPYNPSSSKLKNSMAIGAAIGGMVSGSVGAFVVGGLAVYRTWRIQKIAHAKPLQEKQQLKLQCDQLMETLIDFAEWFTHHLLKYRVDLYAYQLRQIEIKLVGKIPEAVISTTLFAYKFETYQRALKLYEWMQKQLAHDHPKQKVQAGWVALAQSHQFMSIELKQRITRINAELEKYKRMTQYGVQFAQITPQVKPTTQTKYAMQTMQMRYKMPS